MTHPMLHSMHRTARTAAVGMAVGVADELDHEPSYAKGRKGREAPHQLLGHSTAFWRAIRVPGRPGLVRTAVVRRGYGRKSCRRPERHA